MKTYILQKDLPDVKAGAEFKLGVALDAYFLTSDKTGTKYNCYSYPKDFVENTPDWFKAVPDLDKPPLGLMPKYLHDEKRLDDIREAMGRWDNACKTIPQEWINEEKELLKAMKDRRNSTLANEEKFKNDAERFFHRSCDVMKIEIDKSAIYFQKGDEGFAFDAQYVFKKLAGL
jgi:hypothetical protein